MNKDDIYFEAMKARDSRFDGKFYVGVKTTGIYCRPICPAKPKKENVEFFHNQEQAKAAGYRPCKRCHPESIPQSSVWIGKSAVVQRAIKFINTHDLFEMNEDELASQFSVTARHLRRIFVAEIGKTPKQLFFENRILLARKLIVETALPITEIAFASGYSSIRRFNDAFKERFKKAPSEIRRNNIIDEGGLKISLPYQSPFDFDGLMKSYENHRMGNLEWFREGCMHRVIAFGEKVGKIIIKNDQINSSLIVSIDFPDTSWIHSIISRVRALFDLDSAPVMIANVLEKDVGIKKILKNFQGIRLPSGWDPFEVAISTILGQLVSVKRGRELVNDLIELIGKESDFIIEGRLIKLFPSPKQIAESDLKALKTTSIRKQTLIEFSKAVLEKRISLEPTQDVNEFIKKVLTIKGIGPWTAQYMALKVLRDTDIFPKSDLILARALKIHSPERIDSMSPWRGYVAALFWRVYAETLKKTKKESHKNHLN